MRQVTEILVIEDDRAIRDLLGELMADEGYTLVFAEQLDQVAAGLAPDLVITDLVGIGGYERGRARAAVRSVQERFPATPLIVCTGHEDALKEPDLLGAAAVMGKPFNIEALVQAVARLVAR